MSTGTSLALRRRAIGLERSAFCAILMMSPYVLQRIELGIQEPRDHEAARIERALTLIERAHRQALDHSRAIIAAGGKRGRAA